MKKTGQSNKMLPRRKVYNNVLAKKQSCRIRNTNTKIL